MTRFVLPPPPIPSVAIQGSDARFPVRRIYCVGRNYAAHVREMGNDPNREPPIFFTKPADTLVESGASIPYPPDTDNLHYEIELVVALAAGGVDVARERALGLVYGYGVGIDLTRRDLQTIAKDNGRPWDMAKGFDRSAPCSALQPVDAIGHPARGRIWLAVDGAVRQDADLAEQIWPVEDVIAALSRTIELRPGDLIFTGTPAGVGAIKPGQVVTGGIDGVGTIAVSIVERQG